MNSITPEGKEKLESERADLLAKRIGVIQQLKEARELGDLSENAAYSVARDSQTEIDTRVQEIDHILKTSEVSEGPKDKSIVEVGNTVEVESEGKKMEFSIVGSVEADPAKGEISGESPIGSALMGAKVGETVEAQLPAGEKPFTIKSIS